MRNQVRTAKQGYRPNRLSPYKQILRKSSMGKFSSMESLVNLDDSDSKDDEDIIDEVTVDRLRKRLNPQKSDASLGIKTQEAESEPVDKFSQNMQNELTQYKSDLSKFTNVENLITHLL